MTNLEFYKDKILENINNHCSIGCAICLTLNGFDIEDGCSDIICDSKKMIDWMSEEYKGPVKLKRWEYDLIRTNDMSHNRAFESFNTYMNMKRIGHFAGIKNTSITLEDILNNCEVIDD